MPATPTASKPSSSRVAWCAESDHDSASDAITDPNFFTGSPPPEGTPEHEVFENATNLHASYSELVAEIVSTFRTSIDPLDPNGGALLDRTVIPYVTEVSHCGHALDGLPALVFGGRALGMQGGQFQSFESSPRPFNDFWVTVAEPFLGQSPLAQLSGEVFVKSGVTTIPGLWVAPV